MHCSINKTSADETWEILMTIEQRAVFLFQTKTQHGDYIVEKFPHFDNLHWHNYYLHSCILQILHFLSIGTPIYQLDNKAMGCIFPLWAIITISVTAVLSIIVIVVINRKWEAIKFLLFVRFNYLVNDDGPENLDEMEFDAFVTYRYVENNFTKIVLNLYVCKQRHQPKGNRGFSYSVLG